MVDSYGETVLCSLVHNPRCLQTLREPLMSGGSSSTSSLHSSVGYPVSLPPPPPPPPLPSIYSDLVSLSNSINLSNALIMTEGPLLFEDTIGGWGRDHMIPEVGENQLELPQLRPFWRPFFSESTDLLRSPAPSRRFFSCDYHNLEKKRALSHDESVAEIDRVAERNEVRVDAGQRRRRWWRR